ncbi:secreted antigen 1 [Babesia caballi]|uniref:Secreted antigen 1 n=1 Tax=Babesia caballi TaxID=5871 RepID=A0AAV4LLQ2_BABCB|nr:secreted antigen 1 [Babesia caballi]
MSYDCSYIEFPTTLKQTLDFLSKLKDLNAANMLANELKNKDGFKIFKETSSISKIEINLQHLLDCADELRKKIVSKQETMQYGDYDNLKNPNNEGCIERCVNILIGILPKLHATLDFLSFHVNGIWYDRGGGRWRSYTCNQTNQPLFKWLTKSKETPSSTISNSKVFRGGYNGPLSQNLGSALAEPLQQLVLRDFPGGCLQNILIYLLIDNFWSYNGTASALTFVAVICGAVTRRVFDEQEAYQKLKSKLAPICMSLSESVISFTCGDGTDSTCLVALHRDSVTHYELVLESHYFTDYLSWLKININVLIGFLTDLSIDSKFWRLESLKNATHSGPFPYGFMFGSKWTRDVTWESARQETSEAINKVIADLRRLIDCLKESEKAKPATSARGAAEGVARTTQVSVGETGNTNAPSRLVSTASNQRHTYNGDNLTTESSGSSTSQSPETGDGSALTPGSSLSGSHRNGTFGSVGTETSGARPTERTREGVTPSHVGAEVQSDDSGSSATNVTTRPEGIYGRSEDVGSHHTHSGEPEKRSQAETPYEGGNSTITIGGAAGGVAVLGGGGAALYFLNVGGIKTLITGVP